MLCMGPPQAEDALRKCISFGATDAVLVTDRAFAGADTLATSYALAAASARSARSRRWTWCSPASRPSTATPRRSGPGIAKRLGLQLLTYVSKHRRARPRRPHLTVERRAEGGVQVLRPRCPA
jgi:electron transfer flavoprotein beta subunit